MNQLEDAKKKYDDIPIPKELSKRVQEAIEYSEEMRQKKEKVIQMKRRRIAGRSLGTAAAIAVAFTVLLNTNTAFAESISEVPVIGAVAKVLTFRSYEKDQGDLKISVEIPSVEMISEDTKGLTDAVNEEIHSLCKQYADEAVKRAEEYKEAFLATGGTEAEWEAHNIEIKVWYEVQSQTEDYLSFAVMGSENWNSGYSENRYYNIDLKEEKLVTLKDVLGENYIQTANESIEAQMEERTLNDGLEFFTAEEGGFAGISDETKFYMNEAGNPVIVFEKYEIAPGAAGRIEFEIVK